MKTKDFKVIHLKQLGPHLLENEVSGAPKKLVYVAAKAVTFV